MTKLRLAALAFAAVSACVMSSYCNAALAAGVRTYEVPNDPQRNGGASAPLDNGTRIEQLFPNDNNSWISNGPTGTYGCSYIAATRTVSCN